MNSLEVSFDSILALAFKEAERQELCETLPLEELNQKYVPSPELNKRILKIIDDEKRRIKFRRFTKTIKKLAVAACIVVTATACVFVPVEAVQKAVVSTVIEWYNEFTKFVFKTDAAPQKMPDSFTFGYIPDGYVAEEPVKTDGTYNLIATKDRDMITIFISAIGYNRQVSADNEHSINRVISFEGKKYDWFAYEDGNHSLIWEDNGLVLQVVSSADIDTCLKIAQNIKY